MTQNKNVLFYYIYGNRDWKYNVVAPEHIESHIEYNKVFRPGRLMFRETEDGFEMLNNGMIKEEYLEPYKKQAEEFFAKETISRAVITVPYC